MKNKTIAILGIFIGASCSETTPLEESTTNTNVQETLVEITPSAYSPLRLHAYLPSDLPENSPLVVALHGCDQTAENYVSAGWNTFAELWDFAVIYPEKGDGSKCFSWSEASQSSRDKGEAKIIASMVDDFASQHQIDRNRIFITGLSAGGGMTSAMLANYPDVFSAGAVMAGVPFRCSSSLTGALSCMFYGRNYSAEKWGDFVRDAAPQPDRYPRVSVWHGTADAVVSAVNAGAQVAQWTNVHGMSSTATLVEETGNSRHSQYLAANGAVVVEEWLVDGMAHGTAVDPDSGCGRSSDYVLDVGLCSTYHAATFFGLNPEEPQVAAPEVAGTEPDPDPLPEEFACREFHTTNYAHALAFRAYFCGGELCALGSDTPLGAWSIWVYSTLSETAPGYFEEGGC